MLGRHPSLSSCKGRMGDEPGWVSAGASHWGHGGAGAGVQAWRLLCVGQLRAGKRWRLRAKRRLGLQQCSQLCPSPRQRLLTPRRLRGSIHRTRSELCNEQELLGVSRAAVAHRNPSEWAHSRTLGMRGSSAKVSSGKLQQVLTLACRHRWAGSMQCW
jgi:hypothetical protein